jgi:hypothetical protein
MSVTLQDLFQGTEQLRDKIRDTANFGVTQIFGSPKTNNLGVEGKFNALTDKSRSFYKTMIVWSGLSIIFTEDAEHPLKIETFPGIFIYTSKPSITGTDVSVRCTCADYYYTWWYYNKSQGGLAGTDFPRYRRKVPDSGRGPRNPAKVPGCCKHILVLANYMAEKGWLKS